MERSLSTKYCRVRRAWKVCGCVHRWSDAFVCAKQARRPAWAQKHALEGKDVSECRRLPRLGCLPTSSIMTGVSRAPLATAASWVCPTPTCSPHRSCNTPASHFLTSPLHHNYQLLFCFICSQVFPCFVCKSNPSFLHTSISSSISVQHFPSMWKASADVIVSFHCSLLRLRNSSKRYLWSFYLVLL